MTNQTIFWIVGILLIIGVWAGAFLTYDYFYEMKETNCESIMNSDYVNPTDDVANCIKFYNYPFVNFTLLQLIIFPIFLSLMIVMWVMSAYMAVDL